MSLTGLGEIFDFGAKIIDKIFPDKTQADQAKAALAQAQLQGELAEVAQAWDNAKQQAVVNAAEASNANLFVAGWRPGIGWICGAAFGWAYVLQPLGLFISAAFGHPLNLPSLDIEGMMPVLLGMLGLGGMRTAEKIKGAAPASHA